MKRNPKRRSLIARVMIDLPKGYRVWRVLAVRDGDDLQYVNDPPIDCQIVGPVAFLVGPPETKRRLQRAARS